MRVCVCASFFFKYTINRRSTERADTPPIPSIYFAFGKKEQNIRIQEPWWLRKEKTIKFLAFFEQNEILRAYEYEYA
jgi:hypothetical protein